MDDPAMPALEAVAELAGLRLAEHDLPQVLQRVVDLTRQVVPGAIEVSVTLLEGERAYTAAFTGRLAVDLDERQYERGYGPCMDAAQAGLVIVVDDMATESRWPDYTPQALALGVRSSLSVALPVQHAVIGGLNVYGAEPNAFDEAAVKIGQSFAAYAAIAVANVSLYAGTAARADQMWEAMQSRAVVEQAKGILMRDQRCSPEEAFDMLRASSTGSTRKLRDIAAAIVESTQRGA